MKNSLETEKTSVGNLQTNFSKEDELLGKVKCYLQKWVEMSRQRYLGFVFHICPHVEKLMDKLNNILYI